MNLKRVSLLKTIFLEYLNRDINDDDLQNYYKYTVTELEIIKLKEILKNSEERAVYKCLNNLYIKYFNRTVDEIGLNTYYEYAKTENGINELEIILKNSKEHKNYKEKNINYKDQYINICLKNMDYIKNIDLPQFYENSYYESVLVEYRCLPHLEFIIRNTIIKLGVNWSHTIICGNLNYDFMVNMCETISKKIKIIKTNYDNLFPSDYSRFLSSLDFWNLLNGEKILIYQDDTCIFKNNIDDFLKWDYIGAPWIEKQNDNKSGVGNGGLSLRTKSIMVKIIQTISIDDTKYNSSTLKYIENTNSNVLPEDVYFSLNMEKLGIGLLADRVSAFNFSTESILNTDSFGGHQFWLCDPEWKNRIYENIVIQFNPNYKI